MTIFTDAFTRANAATLGSNWTKATGAGAEYTVASNQAVPGSYASDSYNSYTGGGAISADQFSECDVTVVGGASGNGIGPTVRALTASKTHYAVAVTPNEIDLIKVNNNAWSQLAIVTPFVWTASDRFRIQISGSAITVQQNGTTIPGLSSTDSALASGNPGLYSSTPYTSGIVDNWEGGPLADLVAEQVGHASADVSVGTWTTDTGATTNLYQAIDETTPSDTDYIISIATP